MDLSLLAEHDLDGVPLEEIAFAVAREKYPDFDADHYRGKIDEYARRADQRVGGVVGAHAIVQGLSHYLFDEEGFSGNSGDYYNPANSFLNDVLDTRQGIPITLSILFIAIGRRIGMNVRGVSFPGHFLVRYESEDGVLFIDPYHKGKILTEAECRDRLKEMYGNDLPYHDAFLEPAGHREILLRMLTNLKLIAFMQRDYPMALKLLNRILLFKPEGPFELKERGLVEYQLECFGPAFKDLETYLKRQPDDPDRPDLENYLEDLRGKVDRIM
ncbi:MAG TPA: tetratricopeptide repeat protein [bacterium]|nr:tetratricopeptide repeat protein [bacterium]